MSRRRLPAERRSVTKTFRLGDETVYGVVGFYDDDRPGELFFYSRAGEFTGGMMDALAQMVSLLLQTGTPVAEVAGKLRFMKFEPSGFTRDEKYPQASSLLDYVAQWLLSMVPGEAK